MGVSLKCACALQLLLWRQVCLCSAHAQNHVALLFINEVGGSRRGLSIRLSGYPACLWNQGVWNMGRL